MLRAAILALTLIVAVAAVTLWRTGEPVHTLRMPELGPAPVAVRVAEETRVPSTSSTVTRIGNFERPERSPRYEVLEQSTVRQGEVRAARLLIDTRARSKADYELIAQDLKARYAEYDAVTAEFTDTEALLDYNGAALIFNTMRGATYMGFFFGP
ncbi:MAG TPA: hypothetical protein VFE21_10605, partial [Rubrobacteraceae bacterium]|nr:hypothetical protein [Rubrobacteraceae bacterium]